jgi:septal ring factor EnvC (AmiA/AmiB activator)
MNDALIGMLGAGVFSLLTIIVTAAVNWRKNRIEADRMEAELDKIDLETVITLKRQIKELIEENKTIRQEMSDEIKNLHKEYRDEIAEVTKRVRFLEDELRKRVNGYARALKYINSKKSPDETIPDFLIDTQERITRK